MRQPLATIRDLLEAADGEADATTHVSLDGISKQVEYLTQLTEQIRNGVNECVAKCKRKGATP